MSSPQKYDKESERLAITVTIQNLRDLLQYDMVYKKPHPSLIGGFAANL